MKAKVFRKIRSGDKTLTKHTKDHMCLDPMNCQCLCTTCKHAFRRARRRKQ